MATTVRQRTRDTVRLQLASEAWSLITLHGPDITVDELVNQMGISRATFFRYFPSKDEVVATYLAGDPVLIPHALTARLAAHPTESVWSALESTMTEVAPAHVKTQVEMVIAQPSWYARFLLRRVQHVDGIAHVLESQRHLSPTAARATAAMAVGILDSVLREWTRTDRTFAELVREAIRDSGVHRIEPFR